MLSRTVQAVGNRQRIVLLFIAVSRTAGGALFGTAVTVYLGEMSSPFVLTLSFSLFSLGLMVFSPVWGTIADVTGQRKTVLIITTAGTALAVAPLLFTVSVPVLVTTRVLSAVFLAGFQSVILTIVSAAGGDAERGRSIGFYNSAQSGGDIVGQLLVGYLLGVLLPREMYAVVTCIGVITLLLVLLIADPTNVTAGSVRPRAIVSESRRRLIPSAEDRDLFGKRGLGWLYVGLCLRSMTQKGLGSVLPVFLVADVGLSSVVMGIVLAVSPVVRVGSMYLLGRVSDRTGRKKLIVVGLTGSGIQSLLIVAALLPSNTLFRAGVSATGQVVHALTFSALVVGGVAFIGDVSPPERESELIGLRSTARGLGGVVGPLLVGAIATFSNYATAFIAITGISFFAAVLVARKLDESHRMNMGSIAGID